MNTALGLWCALVFHQCAEVCRDTIRKVPHFPVQPPVASCPILLAFLLCDALWLIISVLKLVRILIRNFPVQPPAASYPILLAFLLLLSSDSAYFNFSALFQDMSNPGWKAFYDSLTPQTAKMPDPWDALSGLDRLVKQLAVRVHARTHACCPRIRLLSGYHSFSRALLFWFPGWLSCGVCDSTKSSPLYK